MRGACSVAASDYLVSWVVRKHVMLKVVRVQVVKLVGGERGR